ncbi:MAG: methyltransferase domain-containing protein [Anaerolineae bacterium]
MDQWLRDNLVCPRDHKSLEETGSSLICPDGHKYPVIDGIPVMLLDEVIPTQWNTTSTLNRVAAYQAGQPSDLPDLLSRQSDGIDPHVQDIVSATCGNLYGPLVNRLSRYPIPELRLPQSSGEMFLDIGCNWGRWCVAAARKGYNPVGIDPAIEAIIAARKVSRQLGVQGRYAVADARYLPFAPHTFDTAFSYSVLQHFSKENARLALAEVSRVLKQDGLSLIQMPNAYGVRSLYYQVKRGFREGQDFDVRYWTPSELKTTFSKIIGKTTATVDGYFGLGIQPSDVDLLPTKYQLVVRASELLRRVSLRVRWMVNFADSIYLTSVKDT